jgi:hypothetical protein
MRLRGHGGNGVGGRTGFGHRDVDIRRRYFHHLLLHLRRRRRRRLGFGFLLLDDVGLDRRREHLDRLARKPGGERPQDEQVQGDDGDEHGGAPCKELGIVYVGSHVFLIVTCLNTPGP